MSGDQELVEAVSIQNLIVKTLNVDVAAGHTHGQGHDLTGRILLIVRITGVQNGNRNVEGNRRGHIGAVKACTVGIQLALDVLQIQVQVVQQRNVVGGGQCGFPDGLTFGTAAGTAILISCFDDFLHIQLRTGICRREVDGGVRKLDHHIQLGVGLVCSLMQCILCFCFGHASQIDTGNHNIIEDQTVITGITEEEHDTHNGADQQNSCHRTNRNQDDLTIFCQCGFETGGLVGSSGFLLTDGDLLLAGNGRNADRLLATGLGKLAHSDHLLLKCYFR